MTFTVTATHTIATQVSALLIIVFLSGCTSVTVDEFQHGEDRVEAGETVVILGRRHSSDYETEPSLVGCVGDHISSSRYGVQVIEEVDFLNSLYPWFEPRTAPMTPKKLVQLLDIPEVNDRMSQYNLSHIVWIDGQTETTRSTGSIACTIAAGGGGCFGFGSWDDESDYEAKVWDYDDKRLLGKISADASGTSYMPAVIVPIPLIARVQAGACSALGDQLGNMISPKARASR